jgi:hypothetical protein
MLTLMRALKDSRMGVYRVEGHSGACVQLSDLVTNQTMLRHLRMRLYRRPQTKAYRQRTGTLAL